MAAEDRVPSSPSAESLVPGEGDACRHGDDEAAERRMRYCVACAIVDLKLDTWEFIKTHFLFDPGSGGGVFDGGRQLGHDDPDAVGRQPSGEEKRDHSDGFLREFRENYIKASGFDERMKELDAIAEAYFDLDTDEETRTATIDRLWRHMEKELSDRARAVSTGKFHF